MQPLRLDTSDPIVIQRRMELQGGERNKIGSPLHRRRVELEKVERADSQDTAPNSPDMSFFDQGKITGAAGYDRLSANRQNLTKVNVSPGPRGREIAEEAGATFRRVLVTGPRKIIAEESEACLQLSHALKARQKYIEDNPDHHTIWEKKIMAGCLKDNSHEPEYEEPVPWTERKFPPKSKHTYEMKEGVFVVADNKGNKFEAHSVDEYFADYKELMEIISFGPCKTFSYNRLRVLEARFQLHLLLNDHLELIQQKGVSHRDFYNVRKIDNHVHHSACMNQKHLLRFIKSQVKKYPKDIVQKTKDGETRTMEQIFDDLNLTPYDLSIDTLNMRAEKTFHRFDKFNQKYNPIGQPLLREIFLKQNNYTKGKYLARLTKEVFDDLESNKYQFAEYRISIYGRKTDEWETLAAWIVDNKLWSKNVCWMIQVPRLYKLWKKLGIVQSFQQMLDNIFRPLFQATVDPASYPKLSCFLEQVIAFDSVDDESQRERGYFQGMPLAHEWDMPDNPPYSMWSYYMYANITVLNKLRLSKGMNTFTYRPHAGEAGDIEHLAATFLVANSINHGINLYHSPVLQYLYYLAQIGISISPLSNNLLFCKYEDNPFPRFFRRGLNVTLSTDDPLMIHVTKEPLVEEYSVAAQVWKLTSTDLCEIARNSVLQCGFHPKFKAYWIGEKYMKEGPEMNDVARTNVPDIRVMYRSELLNEERAYVDHAQMEILAQMKQKEAEEKRSKRENPIFKMEKEPVARKNGGSVVGKVVEPKTNNW
eukprot:CAMPEP_0197527364 /NCGR_PEP_ID=MMETSP1318-20131121/21276_1 /TAXON_ID=552666 /ORGANISM="Partenskyella glossopodia, Strain RCC365" /LENGTH=761 /DNA_ID=CAMNT_0043081965 /DNA_START=14 /DNA_END=2296 /DNA_ORIENTATION=-